MKYDDEIRARSYRFRDEYVAATPAWYRGELHLAFTLLFTGGVIAWCAMKLQAPTLAQWLAIVPIFLLGNWAEWAAHRYILHRPTRLFSAIYKRHCAVHHRFFTHLTLEYKGQKHWRALLFPPFAPVAFVLAAVPFALVIGVVFSKNAGYIALMTMAAYYLMYEGLHTLSHITDSPLLDRMPFVGTVRRLHVTHHDPELMATQNFNLTFPICDTLFGTRSDAPREVRSPVEGRR
ncbi:MULTISPECIES: sterol desaturase family protein [unclassified Cupriavidus]|uniref:sterol desaturase family protein n=1 Tax=unclassified Cupriavidus TaxID=2640874 RepID=UPI00226FE5C9|nr:sterol desaturase family protein [Cupriavidus sp. D39]MCY0852768.1 sterol desaturase family protein [Cupriavidus sp. D39]